MFLRTHSVGRRQAEATPLAQSTVSQHFKVLREASLIRCEIEGPATCYCLDAENIRWFKEQIGKWLPECT
jgi:DNA-binding transcriptional ArsR family regulator